MKMCKLSTKFLYTDCGQIQTTIEWIQGICVEKWKMYFEYFNTNNVGFAIMKQADLIIEKNMIFLFYRYASMNTFKLEMYA